jgi:hypothetical protein
MKELKDYLHLYIGCKGKFQYDLVRGEATMIGVDNYGVKISCMDDWILFRYFKPILRPLSDMTEEEQARLQLLKDQIEDEDGHNCELEVFAALGNECRKLGIDIDGLIDAGLAIAKTLNPTTND